MKHSSTILLALLMTLQMSAQPIPTRLLDSLGMLQPQIVSNPSAKYLRANQDYALSEGIAMTKGGRIWHLWVAGEDDCQAYMLMTYSDDDGRHWTDSKFVIDPHRDDCPYPIRTIVGNIFTDPDGRLWVFFDQSVTYYDNRSGVWTAHCDNPDDAQPVWSQPQYVGMGCALQIPTVLSDGTWLLPSSLWERRYNNSISLNNGLQTPVVDAFHELDSLRMALVYASQDKGATWQLRGGVKFPEENINEHILTEMPDGRIWMTARSMAGMQQSFSSDGGYTWTAPEQYLPHVNSRHFMLRLASGNLLMVRHGAIDERTSSRCRLTAYVSDDNGATWQGGLTLDERDDVSYPSGFQSPDGHIYICYDHARQTAGEILMAKFTEHDVIAGRLIGRSSRKPAVIYKAALAPCMAKFVFPRPNFRPAMIYDISKASSNEDLEAQLGEIKSAGYGANILVGEGDMDLARHICESLGNTVGIGLQDTAKFAERPYIARFGEAGVLDKARVDSATRSAYLRSFCKSKVWARRLVKVKGNAKVEAWRVGGRHLICISSNDGAPQEVTLKRLRHSSRAELMDPATGERTSITPGARLHLTPEIWIALPRR